MVEDEEPEAAGPPAPGDTAKSDQASTVINVDNTENIRTVIVNHELYKEDYV